MEATYVRIAVEKLRVSSPITYEMLKLLSELESCSEIVQKQNIEKMNKMADEMNEKELQYTFIIELFKKINKMMDEQKTPLGIILTILKRFGFNFVMKNLPSYGLYSDLSSERKIEKMIVDEYEKMEEKDERLIADLSECNYLFGRSTSLKLNSICVPYLLKVALKKEEDEEAQKEVEMALFALSNIGLYDKVPKELYLNEIADIIQYHQKHHNLTQLAYQSAWQFLINRYPEVCELIYGLACDLNFVKEAPIELEELTRRLTLKMKEEGKGGKEVFEVMIIRRWLLSLEAFFSNLMLWKEECYGLVGSFMRALQASKDYFSDLSFENVCLLESMVTNKRIPLDALFKERVIDVILEEILQTRLKIRIFRECLAIFKFLAGRLDGKMKEENGKAKQKGMKRKFFDKLEEEGYEDSLTSIYVIVHHRSKRFRNSRLLTNSSDYFVFL
ncbi:uncharacterized protein MONOS_5961 [Monocercomonoides exilis]|uniref:uncharacterized protein n=1 Tax=Monocercomonoides exilis TaxID=2049356 RepID=UPI003559F3C5|nr:hypothetical protein MONOS_5961 [Monocercomonoides exilis]|eukprot:MONOS_5961.1-p1 / transcript=MONOS_5961.1 / gene=MONOS_5961 / organism=Monocercomonoides_exilis_PA203 / gene_product=unspecified product / transcript_product=unspecified product / location=Mono_scaffold00180:91733-93188(-) / protein_length=446 / sequence_SO=supercontig / SO=protein_coding / is_pseudo=false